VPRILPPLELRGLAHPDVSPPDFAEQIAALSDLVRQVAGDAKLERGSAGSTDPLLSPFTLYVDPYIGSDKFVAGTFNTYEGGATDEEKNAQKLKRLHLQHLTCGFSPQRPFRTVNRAAIEAWIITSRDYFSIPGLAGILDRVLLRLSAGRHTIYNDPGTGTVAAWADGFEPTPADLIAFNPARGGLVLPRSASFGGVDEAQCFLVPSFVPPAADEAADYGNRTAILRATPASLGSGLVFADAVGVTTSHHLLDAVAMPTKAELDEAGGKVFTACGAAGLSQPAMVARPTELEGALALYDFGIASSYGLSGVFLDGAGIEARISRVDAKLTQGDPSSWELNVNGAWVTPTAAQLAAADRAALRPKAGRHSRLVTAIHDAVATVELAKAVGAGTEFLADLGGEIIATGCSSTDATYAAAASGYRRTAAAGDRNWTVSGIRVPALPQSGIEAVERIDLGVVASIDAARVVLAAGLEEGLPDVPRVLLERGFSLRAGTLLWIENPTGADWPATLAAGAWSDATPAEIKINGLPAGVATNVAGRRVYVRRLRDRRSAAERRVSVLLANTASAEQPRVGMVLQTDPDRAGGAIARSLDQSSEVFVVGAVRDGEAPAAGVLRTATISLRQAGDERGDAGRLALDTDTDPADLSGSLGIVWGKAFADPGPIREQYRAGADYQGAHGFLVALGFGVDAAHTALLPTAKGHVIDPTNAAFFPTLPAGGAASGLGHWAVEFCRPSLVELRGYRANRTPMWTTNGGGLVTFGEAVEEELEEELEGSPTLVASREGWTTINPSGPAGLIVVEKGDLSQLKVLDGVRPYAQLPYFSPRRRRMVSDYKRLSNTWTEAFQEALLDPQFAEIYVDYGRHDIMAPLFSTIGGKKLIGEGVYPSECILRFRFNTPNTSGIWFQNKGRVANLAFAGTDFTQASAQNLLRFERTAASVNGPDDESDMDSSVSNCNFSDAKKFKSSNLADQAAWGFCIRYVGRNLEVDSGSFSDLSGGCISLSFNPTPTGTGTAASNDHQLPFYGHRKLRITGNLFHTGAGSRILHLSGPVTLRGALIADNMIDIGAQLLYCDGDGGIADSLITGTILQHQVDGDSDRAPMLYFKKGQVRNLHIKSNVLTGSDNINGTTYLPEVSKDSRYPEHVLRFGVDAKINGLYIDDNDIGYAINQLIRIQCPNKDVGIRDNRLIGGNLAEAPAVKSALIRISASSEALDVRGNSWATLNDAPLLDLSGVPHTAATVKDNPSTTKGAWITGHQNADQVSRLDFGPFTSGRRFITTPVNRTNASKALDPQLQFVDLVPGAYQFAYQIFFRTQPGADFAYDLVAPAVSSFAHMREFVAPDGTTGRAIDDAPGANTNIAGAAGTKGHARGDGQFVVTAPGTFGIQWAQATAQASVNTRLEPGSFLTLTRVL
jgi:hypothetical protein